MKKVLIRSEKIAQETCYQLVRLGKIFTCSTAVGGWMFEVEEKTILPCGHIDRVVCSAAFCDGLPPVKKKEDGT